MSSIYTIFSGLWSKHRNYIQSEPQPEGRACGRNLPVAAMIDQFHAVCSIDSRNSYAHFGKTFLR